MKFQQEYKLIYKIIAAVGVYPPGFEDIVASRTARIIFRVLAYMPMLLLIIHVLGIYLSFVKESMSNLIFLMLFRRTCGFLFMAIKLLLCIVRHNKMNEFYKHWNDGDISEEEYEKRQDILRGEMTKSYVYLPICIAGSTVLPQLYVIRFIIDPHDPQSQYSWYPHADDHPYSLLFGVLHCFLMLTCFTGAAYDVVCLHIMFMLSAQLKYLKKSLAAIFQNYNQELIPNNAGVDRSYNKLMKWIKAHQRALRWGNDIKHFFSLEISCKFVFIISYSCLVAFSIPYYLKADNFVDTAVMIFYAMGTFSMQFYLTKIAEDIATTSGTIFSEAYGEEWHRHSLKVQKATQIISCYTINRPLRFYALRIFEDNIANFLEILVMAYRCLSVLLQMPDF